MRWSLAALCSIAGIASVGAAAAQPAPAAGPPAPIAPVVATPPAGAPAADPRGDAAWRLYHDAFAALMHGERTRARDLASALLRDYPDHPATRLVRGAHLGLAPGVIDEHGAGPERRDHRETASRGARAELALFQSLHGIALGIEACVVLECDSGEAFLGIALAGGAVGAVVPLSLPDLTSGQRALLNSGAAWGAVNAGLLLIAGDSGGQSAQKIGLTLIAGQGAGLLTGALLAKAHPTAGQVALANSGGEWVGALTQLVLAAGGADLDQHEAAITALVAIDAGIAAGAYLAARWPRVSRAQSLVIDAGGIAGAVGGGSLGILISGDAGDRTTSALGAVGAAVGLGAAAYLTRDWSEGGTSSLRAYLAPPEHGRGGVAGVGWTW